jgi:hypothetical protein
LRAPLSYLFGSAAPADAAVVAAAAAADGADDAVADDKTFAGAADLLAPPASFDDEDGTALLISASSTTLVEDSTGALSVSIAANPTDRFDADAAAGEASGDMMLLLSLSSESPTGRANDLLACDTNDRLIVTSPDESRSMSDLLDVSPSSANDRR